MERSRLVLSVTTSVSLVALVCLFLLPLSCDDTTQSPAVDTAAGTLSTFAQVDDYPLYVMRYYGDYGFDQYLRRGTSGYRDALGVVGDRRDPGRLADPDRGGERHATVVVQGTDDPPWGCTTFAALNEEGEYLLGRNFDWYDHMALLLYTDPPHGYASVSMVDLGYLGFVPGDTSDSNMRQLLRAPFWPFDGMNEKGVAVGMMAVPHAEGGNDPKKVTIGTLDAIRLVLDHAEDVEAAVSVLGRYNIDFEGGPPVHYLVSDATRRSVVIEFVADEMKVIPCEHPWQVATNFVITGYAWTGSPSDCWRYNRAYSVLESKNGIMSGDEAMNLLHSVCQSITMWSVVYGGQSGTISIAMGLDYATIHDFNMEDLKSRR
jgi:hypothetical protein